MITGNVLISNTASKAIASRPEHYYKTSGSVNVKGENLVPTLAFSNLLQTSVDELKTYGKKYTDASGKDLNGTADGNPRLNRSAVTFVNEDSQNYSLTTKISDVSDVHSIDMTQIGILDTTNEEIFEKRDETVKLYDVAYDSEKAVLSWEAVENASEYDIVVSKNADFSSKLVSTDIISLIFFSIPLSFNGRFCPNLLLLLLYPFLLF